mgnify:CR=1 FL=1
MKKEEETFAIRTYDKAELASLYCPGREPGAACRTSIDGYGVSPA